MADVFTKGKRSQIMSKIRSQNTLLEKRVFKQLRARGFYFQTHYSKIPGKPDIAFPRKKIAIFIDSDFWHGYRFFELRKRLPKKYWLQKIENNIKRDKRNGVKLKKLGWKVIRIWEHEIKKSEENVFKKLYSP